MSNQVKRLKSIGISNIVHSAFWLLMVIASLLIYARYNPFISESFIKQDTMKIIKSPQIISLILIIILFLIIFVYSLVIFLKSIFRHSNPYGVINAIINSAIFALLILSVLIFVLVGFLPMIKEIKAAANTDDSNAIANIVNIVNSKISKSCLGTGLIGLGGFIGCGFSVMFCFVSASKTRA